MPKRSQPGSPEAGIETRLQRIDETSANAVGLLRGMGDRSGGARSLIFNAHMDTQGATPAGGEEKERELRGAREQAGLLYGNGLANDKAQLAAQMIAMRAIVRAPVSNSAKPSTSPASPRRPALRRSGARK